MAIYLKDSSDIAALISGSTYSAISTGRKEQIADHFETMPSSVWAAALAVLLTVYSTDEQAFAQALFTDAPPAGGSASPEPPPDATDLILPSITILRAVVTEGASPGSLVRGATYSPAGTTDNAIGFFRTRTGTDADNPPFVVRPNDFDETANPQVWEKEL